MRCGVILITGTLFGGLIGAGMIYKSEQLKIRKRDELNNKNDAILKLYNKWVNLCQEGKTVADYLKKNSVHTVAIYGFHYLGDNLLNDLTNNGVEVKYAVDQNAVHIQADVEVLRLEDELPIVDAIIVTAFYFYDEIKEALLKCTNCPILSLEDILYDM